MDDEDGRNLLTGSIEEFDQEYDCVWLKFERFQKNVHKEKSLKLNWTFWFLIKSVIIPSMIPVALALPFAYAYFRIEQVYISVRMSTSLIVFWVMAWIFLMDMIHLCHWFNYEQVPIIKKEEEIELNQTLPLNKKILGQMVSSMVSSMNISAKTEHDSYSIRSALSLASKTSSLLTVGFADNRRRSSIMSLGHPAHMASASRRSSLKPDSALDTMRRTSRGHSFMQSIDIHKKMPNPISIPRSESNESDLLLDVIPMNPDFFAPDPFAQTNGINEAMGTLKEESEECNEPNDVIPIDYVKPLEILREDSKENAKSSRERDKNGLSAEEVRRSETNLSIHSNKNISQSDMVLKDMMGAIGSSQALDLSAIKYSSNYDLDTNTSDGSLPNVPMNDIFSQNSIDPVREDRIADTGDYQGSPQRLSVVKKLTHSVFNLTLRRTTIRKVVYDPYEDNLPAVTHFSSLRHSVADDSAIKVTIESPEYPVSGSNPPKEEDSEEFELIWSPLFFHMIWKMIFRWIVTPLFVYLVDTSVLITLIVYPFLVIPGSLIAHMLTVTSWIYPIFLRFLTSILTVIMTEMISQFMMYSMIAPLAFIDIRFSSSEVQDVGFNIAKGILKAIIFFLARTTVKFIVIYMDRRAIKHQREKNVRAKETKDKKSENVDKPYERIPESSVSPKDSSLEEVFEDELEDLSYYGQLILALGGHGVPGWMFIFRIHDHLQFAFVAVVSLGMEALMVVSFKNFMEWVEKRKVRRKKAEAKEKSNEARNASKLSKGTISPNMAAIKGIKSEDRNKKGNKKAVAPDVGTRVPIFKGQKTTPETSLQKSISSKNQMTPAIHLLRKSRSSNFDNPENPKNEAMALLAATAFHQDNRRYAVERRFYMCSTYAAIIGSAFIYMIFSTGEGQQKLCSYYGNVDATTVLWRLFAVLSVQFVVDWWFTLNQLVWGLPFAFTAQIETTMIHGYLVTSFYILQSVTVLMAHERGLFGSC